MRYSKLADRIYNMRTEDIHPTTQKEIAEETLQFFVLLAKQLGLTQAVEEMQGLVFDVLNRSFAQ